MDYFQAIVLGAIQGVTEWLPISSQALVFLSSHLFFDIEHDEALKISVWLHSGSLLAVIIHFWKDIVKILTGKDKKLFYFLILSTIMSGVIAIPLLFFLFWVELPEALFTILIGLFLVIVAFLQQKTCNLKIAEKSLKRLSFNWKKDGLIVGIVQGFSALPGFSRSGLTIATLLARKYSLKDTFYLSFLMSVPIGFLAQIVLVVTDKGVVVTSSYLVGALTAAVVGFFSIKALLSFAQKVNFFKATLALGVIIIIIGIIMQMA